MKVLIVDDEPGIRRYLERILELNGIEGSVASDSVEARAHLEHGAFDVILLDVSMPGESGWDLLQAIRAAGDETPVIFLTAHQSTEERVRGLRLGADDYIVKPFESEELLARLEAVHRRRKALPVLTVGPLRIDVGRRIVDLNGERIELSPREFDVLGELVQSAGRTVSRAELLRNVWGIEFDPGTKIVEVQVARLRRKLGRGTTSIIQTVVGEGYRLSEPD